MYIDGETCCAANVSSRGKARHLSVNVSSVQLRKPDFVDQVHSHCRELGALPERIILELTEQAVIENIDETVKK
jgi:EAL domain-containing protein (putative c-di-GMP-specific phosphodiesterase class I)